MFVRLLVSLFTSLVKMVNNLQKIRNVILLLGVFGTPMVCSHQKKFIDRSQTACQLPQISKIEPYETFDNDNDNVSLLTHISKNR